MIKHGGAGEQHGHRVGDVLAHQRRRRAVRCLGHCDLRTQRLVERQEHRLGSGDRAEEGEDEIGKAVAVAVQRRHHQRAGAGLA